MPNLNAKTVTALLTDLYAAYPGIKLKVPEEEALPRVWLEALRNQDQAAVRRAVSRHIRTSPYWPSPAQIIKLLEDDLPAREPEPHEPGNPIVDAVVAITGEVGASSAAKWFTDTDLVEVSGGLVELRTPTEFQASWIKSHYGYLLNAIATKALGRQVTVRVRMRAA